MKVAIGYTAEQAADLRRIVKDDKGLSDGLRQKVAEIPKEIEDRIRCRKCLQPIHVPSDVESKALEFECAGCYGNQISGATAALREKIMDLFQDTEHTAEEKGKMIAEMLPNPIRMHRPDDVVSPTETMALIYATTYSHTEFVAPGDPMGEDYRIVYRDVLSAFLHRTMTLANRRAEMEPEGSMAEYIAMVVRDAYELFVVAESDKELNALPSQWYVFATVTLLPISNMMKHIEEIVDQYPAFN